MEMTMTETTKQLQEVYLLYMSVGSSNDKLISIHKDKKSAIRAKREEEAKAVNKVASRDVHDYYITQRYVIED